VITLALIANGNLAQGSDPPTWVIVSAAAAIGLGTYIGGWRIIQTMGMRIIKMDTAQGFSAQGAGAAVILASSHYGFPLSTTHVITGGVMGAGAARRVSAVRWGLASNIAVAWLLTLPAAAAIGGAAYGVTRIFGTGAAGPVIVTVAGLAATVLAVSRRLPQLLELQRERTWQPLEANELADVTIGVIGMGSIGRRVAELATAFGATVIGVGRSSGPGELTDVLGRSDFIVLALPLTVDTEEMFDAELLSKVKPGSWLINVARGRLVDERALVRALHDGPLGGAVLDTFIEEPLPATSVFYSLPNSIVTPHTSWSSARALDRSVDLFCENLVRYTRGEPLLNLVDPQVGY